jgi:hypothetical protein
MGFVNYKEQNIFLKISSVILGICIITMLDFDIFLLYLFISFIFLCPQIELFKYWLSVLLKLLPFFSSILFLAILFKLDIIAQLKLIMKISALILLSVYLIKTSTTDDLISMVGKNKNFETIVKYVILTINFIPFFYNNFVENYKIEKNIIETFSKSVHETYDKKDQVVELTVKSFNKKKSASFLNFPNAVLEIYIMFQILLFSIKF